MHQIIVTPQTAAKLDAFLLAQFPLLSPGRLHKYLRENKLKVNGKKYPLSHRLCAGDIVKVFLPQDLLLPPSGPAFLQAKPLFAAIYEDEHVLIADKPAGLLVMDENEAVADTLIHRALLYLYNKGAYRTQDAFTPCLCHRLDTGTSGLVLIAKTAQAESVLKDLIKSRSIVKKYICVTFGHPAKKADTLHAFLQKDAARGLVRIVEKPSQDTKAMVLHTNFGRYIARIKTVFQTIATLNCECGYCSSCGSVCKNSSYV